MSVLRRFFHIRLFILLSIFWGLSEVKAQSIPLDAEWGAQTYGRAGSAAASASGLDAFSTNPAGLMRSYGRGVFGGHYIDLPQDRSSWGVGLIDGRKSVIGGFRFQWYEQEVGERQNYDIAAVYQTPYGAAGVSANIYKFSGLGEDNGWKLSQTAGVLIPVFQGLTLGAYGQAFLDNIESEVQAPTLAMGAAYEKDRLFRASFQADRQFDLPDQAWNYSVSAEFLFKEFFIARSGYRFDNENDRSFWSVGGGMDAPKLSLQGYYMREVDSPKHSSWGINTSFLF